MAPTVRCCRRCLLPDAVPGLSFDDADVCDICRATPPVEQLVQRRAEIRREVERLVAPHRSVEPYACVVAFSGGKDSSFTLKLLVERFQLRCLAVTVDNGFLSKGTAENCKAVCGALGVDHVLFTPNQQFVRTMYGASATREDMHAPAALQRASSICNSCIGLINAHMLQKALEVGAPLVAGGYLGGQLPKDAAMMTIRPALQARLRSAMVNRFVQSFGDDARRYFALNRPNADAEREIVVINPMLGFVVPEDEIIRDIEQLGWKRPRDTGLTSTNCRLNDLGIYIHTRRHGFHPYAFEIADQLRHGLISIEEASHKLSTLPERTHIEWLAERIGVSADDL